eukprot:CAMPEP_0119261178 /NCGR_PEP_ID=MMETSP1329-20130426/1320_1 /TAXON_ID=114041 /ORGANISM="Genus nov. species nov., Strain RCC1024" /LENGTH=193 /DNA_ID=CAMNT_0007260689 /DNA_START=235 /DNA_END=813 /DNA_ORIENTATION=-
MASWMEFDYDDDLYADGTIAWARTFDRPWWPCVLFSSWDAVRTWEWQAAQGEAPAFPALPRVLGEPPPLQEHQALACLLGDKSYVILDRRKYQAQDWDYLTPEAIMNDIGAVGADARDPLALAHARAVAEARRILAATLGRGGLEALEDAGRFDDETLVVRRYGGKKKRGPRRRAEPEEVPDWVRAARARPFV